jgi:hypothetical protein
MIGDPAVYALLIDQQYKLPTILPDGKYNAKTFEIKIIRKGGTVRR